MASEQTRHKVKMHERQRFVTAHFPTSCRTGTARDLRDRLGGAGYSVTPFGWSSLDLGGGWFRYERHRDSKTRDRDRQA